MNICKLISGIILFCSLSIHAQNNLNTTFTSPFKFPMLLSANFGELRGNHFHGGIDIKTGGVEGKPIYCIADGYVSRVLISEGGYGNALFITHNNGYTSVYGHIKSFTPAIEKVIKEYQYKNETFTADLRFEPDFVKYKAGDFIALSGNEGMSFGPHLHLEIRDSKTNEYVNPLLFYKNLFTDNRAPVAQLIAIYPQRGAGVVEGSQSMRTIPINALSKSIAAWGRVSFGIKAFDYMTGTTNHYGVHSVKLMMDDKEIYNSRIDGVLTDENRRINGYADYKELKLNKRWIMRSFSLPGNSLRFVNTQADRGVVDINEERDYNFVYELSDIYGNISRYKFTINGKKSDIAPYIPKGKMIYWNRANVIQEPGFELVIPKGMLYDDEELNWSVSSDSAAVSNIYRINNIPIPLHSYCSIMIGVKNRIAEDSTKYYIAAVNGKNKSYIGGKFENGWVKASIRELGTYTVAIDTVAPKVLPLSKNLWRSGKIQFRVFDNETGIKSYKVYINDKFHPFSYSLKNRRLAKRYPIVFNKGVSYKIEVVVEDNCGNITREKYII